MRDEGDKTTRSATEILSAILKNPTDIDHVRSLVSPDVVYFWLNHDNAELKRIMTWAGPWNGPERVAVAGRSNPAGKPPSASRWHFA